MQSNLKLCILQEIVNFLTASVALTVNILVYSWPEVTSQKPRDVANSWTWHFFIFKIDQCYQISSRKHMSTVILSNESTITQNNV